MPIGTSAFQPWNRLFQIFTFTIPVDYFMIGVSYVT
nr:MAG TPA: hypothetical protein [Caudoviricetes sp.]